jgi:hypothetical protein
MMRPYCFFTFVLVVFVTGVLFLAAFMAAGVFPVQDLSQYWSASHLVRQNPYSYQAVAEFQHAHGIFVDPPLVLKNPPWAIPFILPLALFGYRFDFALWAVLSFLIVSGSSYLIWKERAFSASFSPVLLPLLFGPTIVQLMLGQWTVLVLLGITLFLVAVERGQDWLAGASLLLVLGKPHVALLFLIALVLWIMQSRRWIIALSASLSLLSSSTIVELLNPHIFAQFLSRTTQVVHEAEFYPNLGGMLYLLSGLHALAFVPQIAGLIWLVFYWKSHRQHWNWWEQGPIVILCSVMCSYYSYPLRSSATHRIRLGTAPSVSHSFLHHKLRLRRLSFRNGRALWLRLHVPLVDRRRLAHHRPRFQTAQHYRCPRLETHGVVTSISGESHRLNRLYLNTHQRARTPSCQPIFFPSAYVRPL